MKRKWFPVLFLPLLLAAEDFEAYPDTTALRRVWQEFDAGNPAPGHGRNRRFERQGDAGDGGTRLLHPLAGARKSVRREGRRDQAGRERRRRESGGRGADRGGAPEKGGADLGRMVIPLRSGETRTVTVPVAGLGKLDQFAVLLMFNKTGGILAATVDDVAVAAAEQLAWTALRRAADSTALQQAWPGFDAGNPGPERGGGRQPSTADRQCAA